MKYEPHSTQSPLPPLQGFETVRRFWDAKRNLYLAKIQPGEFYVTKHDEGIITVLGSCIAACIRDKELGIGGMNHFMLPIKGSIYDKSFILSDAARYGNWAMEYLINQILKTGGRRRMLEVKIFGGGNVLSSISPQVSLQNIKFILDYLYNENLLIQAKDLGGTVGRLIVYYPRTGLVQMKSLTDIGAYHIPEMEDKYYHAIEEKIAKQGDIELF